MPSLIPSLISALAMGWLPVEADRLADMIKSYSFFSSQGQFFSQLFPPGDLPALVVPHHSNWPGPEKFSEGSSVGIAPKGERAQT